jgi:protein-tyrosine phosphatase
MFRRILIICTGNICRSPMAAALLAQRLSQRTPAAEIESAGLAALVGYPADPLAQEVMREQGLDLSGHRARQLTPTMIVDFDLILAMEAQHVKAIQFMVPSARGRVHQLGQPGGFDIPDPYGRPRQAFVEALQLIDQGLADWEHRL